MQTQRFGVPRASMVDEVTTEKTKPRGMVWPLVLFVVATLFFDYFVLQLESWYTVAYLGIGPGGMFVVQVLLPGLVFGQAAFACVLGGLCGRFWLQGVVLASTYCCIGMGLLFFSQRWSYSISFGEGSMQWGLFAIPCCVLAMSFPLLVMRFSAGWQLARDERVLRQPSFDIEGLFLLTAAVACIVFVARIPPIAWESSITAYYAQLAFMCLIFAGIGLIVALPSVKVAFCLRHPLARILALTFLPTALVLLIIGIIFTTQEAMAPNSSGLDWSTTLLISLVAGLLFSVGISTLYTAGFRLANRNRAAAPVADVTMSRDTVFQRSESLGTPSERPQVQSAQVLDSVDRVTSRYWVGAVFLLGILSSVSVQGLQRWRANAAERHATLYQSVSEHGGSIQLREREVVTLQLGPGATVQTKLADYQYLATLENLSLAGTDVTDEDLRQLSGFPRLKSLDLSHTQISDQGLQHLKSLFQLEHLSLAATKVTPGGIADLLSNRHIQSLDLSDLGLVDDDLSSLETGYAYALKLRNNRLTSAAVDSLLQAGELNELDISGNPIQKLDVSQAGYLDLVLEDVPLTDKDLKIAGPVGVSCLRLSNTGLTDAILPQLLNAGLESLELGPGGLTEAGLAKSPVGSLNSLKLTGAQFTGQCFEKWQPSLFSLSLSGSGVSDENISFLNYNDYWYVLDLSKTTISDDALPALAKMSISILDLTDTTVTANGLLANPLDNTEEIRVGFGQFNDEDARQLKQKCPQIKIGEVPAEW